MKINLILLCVFILGCGEVVKESSAKVIVHGSSNEVVKSWDNVNKIIIGRTTTTFIDENNKKVVVVGPCIVEYK